LGSSAKLGDVLAGISTDSQFLVSRMCAMDLKL
jgi:hypothetical protein